MLTCSYHNLPMIFYDVNHRLQRINKMVVVNFTKWISEELYAEYLSMLHVLTFLAELLKTFTIYFVRNK